MISAFRFSVIACALGALALSACEGTDPEPTPEVASQITVSPPALTNGTEALFEFAAAVDNPEISFECSVDSSDYFECASPYELEVDEGEHTFRVRGVAGGVTEDPPQSYTWTVDLTPPVTTLTDVPASLDNSVDVDIEFEASEPSTFSCTLDSEAAVDCTSPWALVGLVDGAHTISVEATDLAGNVETDPPSYSWTVDSGLPDTVILSGPEGAVSTTTASFTFTSSNTEELVEFELPTR